jgi:hypothetical protein
VQQIVAPLPWALSAGFLDLENVKQRLFPEAFCGMMSEFSGER